MWLLDACLKITMGVGAVQSLSRVGLFVIPWTAAQHARLPCPSPSPGCRRGLLKADSQVCGRF